MCTSLTPTVTCDQTRSRCRSQPLDQGRWYGPQSVNVPLPLLICRNAPRLQSSAGRSIEPKLLMSSLVLPRVAPILRPLTLSGEDIEYVNSRPVLGPRSGSIQAALSHSLYVRDMSFNSNVDDCIPRRTGTNRNFLTTDYLGSLLMTASSCSSCHRPEIF